MMYVEERDQKAQKRTRIARVLCKQRRKTSIETKKRNHWRMSIIAESTHARKKESAQPILEAIASADKQRKLNSDPPVEK